jgi:regulator of sirC expression with transglutaminase-like and TPR domain
MILVEQLWTEADQHDLDLCIGAVAHEDLDRALLALEGAGAPRQRESEKTLRRWAARLPAVSERSAAGQVEALRELLVDELGFGGDRENLEDPRNGLLSEVLRRRRGRPVLLSALWIIVGRQVGVPVEGMGLPARVLVRVGEAEGLYVDPFEDGAVYTEARLRQKTGELAPGEKQWKESWLEPLSAQELVARTARRLAAQYSHRKENGIQYRMLRFWEAMQPSDPGIPLARAGLAEQVGAYPRALKIYRAIAQQFEGSEEAAKAIDKVTQLSRLPIAEG